MIIKPVNHMICHSCEQHIDASKIAYMSTYAEMFLICTDCELTEHELAEKEKKFAEYLGEDNRL